MFVAAALARSLGQQLLGGCLFLRSCVFEFYFQCAGFVFLFLGGVPKLLQFFKHIFLGCCLGFVVLFFVLKFVWHVFVP